MSPAGSRRPALPTCAAAARTRAPPIAVPTRGSVVAARSPMCSRRRTPHKRDAVLVPELGHHRPPPGSHRIPAACSRLPTVHRVSSSLPVAIRAFRGTLGAAVVATHSTMVGSRRLRSLIGLSFSSLGSTGPFATSQNPATLVSLSTSVWRPVGAEPAQATGHPGAIGEEQHGRRVPRAPPSAGTAGPRRAPENWPSVGRNRAPPGTKLGGEKTDHFPREAVT